MNRRDVQGLDPELKRLWDAILHERELREQHRMATDDALRLQAKKNEEHFVELNHAHGRALEAQERTVPRETFELYRREQDAWRTAVDKQLAEYRGGMRTGMLLLGLGLSILTILLRFVPMPGAP